MVNYLIGGDWNMFYDFPFNWEWKRIIITSQLTKSMIFQRGRYTTNQKYWAYLEYVLNMYRREYWETRIKHVIHHGNTINVGN